MEVDTRVREAGPRGVTNCTLESMNCTEAHAEGAENRRELLAPWPR